MSQEIWKWGGQILAFVGGPATGLAVQAGDGIIKSHPCATALSPSFKSFEEMMRDIGKPSAPIEKCIDVFGTTLGEPWSDPAFQGFICGLAVVVGGVVLWWQQRR